MEEKLIVKYRRKSVDLKLIESNNVTVHCHCYMKLV